MPSITAILAGTIRAVEAYQAVIMAGLAGTIGKRFADPVAIIRIAAITISEHGPEATTAATIIAEESIAHPTTVSSDTIGRASGPILVRIPTQPRATTAAILVRMRTWPRNTTAATLARTADTAGGAADVCSNRPERRAIGPHCSGSERFAEPETTVATPAKRAVLLLHPVDTPNARPANRHCGADADGHHS